jgi:hypothetical protein
MPRGANQKREREYNELKDEFEREGRYPGREEEVAARIVNKQRAQYGETMGARAKKRQGEAPDRGLPIKGFEHLTVSQVVGRLDGLSHQALRSVEAHERKHKNRKTLLEQIERRIRH